MAGPRMAFGFPQTTRRKPHLHEWTVSRYLVLDTSRSILIFFLHLGQFIGSTKSPLVFLVQQFFEGRRPE